MNAFLAKIVAGLKKFFGRGSAFQEIFAQAVTNILSIATPAAIDLLTAVALSKVGEVDGSGLSNTQKRDVVLKELEATAIKEGLKASTAMLNLILETAVNAIKK